MKKTLKFFSMAAIFLAVATLTGCEKENENEQPAATGVVKTSTTTICLDSDASKNLTGTGVKTFVAGEKIAVVYENTSDQNVKVEVTLVAGAITSDGKSAVITVDMTDPKNNGNVKFIYPAAMANDDGTVNYDALYEQDGTLETLSRDLDLSLYEGTLSGTDLPANPLLTNQLAICRFTLKSLPNYDALTGITGFYVCDGSHFYMVTPASATSEPLWVAMKPVNNQSITLRAINSTNRFEKVVTGKSLAAGNMYHLNLYMDTLPEGTLFGTFSVGATTTVRFSQGNLNEGGSFAAHQYDDGALIKEHEIPNKGPKWHIPTKENWEYLLGDNATRTGKRGTAKVCGKNGLVILPDDWVLPKGCTFNAVINFWDDNIYDAAAWAKMEAAGAVFLVAAGYADNSNTYEYGSAGHYWTESFYQDQYHYYYLQFYARTATNEGGIVYYNGYRFLRQSVRLFYY